ncbi:hypothetical protein [Acuticoccus sp.]|uniref:hypothetical protein n=1 Tax=Acuticoccus sp. TaxID=1904378 RepID=UPI003B52F54D
MVEPSSPAYKRGKRRAFGTAIGAEALQFAASGEAQTPIDTVLINASIVTLDPLRPPRRRSSSRTASSS